ncbi:hypothetical protein SRCM100730_01560 [Bacillus velezensis]|uniref:Uncharacterized protein n=2 Tax=Bacillus velezensis TaxID=492670 RepID=I2C3R4_BACAY|nr:hypothetical protein MUS_1262 [Bacillus velezensis YAU B9601-Y2]ARW38453.1 hypothetical protein S101267_01365 [Bacillus amyloliquefaciens]ASB64872.1 hypothetical protein S101413_01425 [Bacillus velezensis]OBR32231.1 hypothetical protein SRCM100731_02221 [Bacillus velezensis]OCB98100.1 hypothetical protein SRCM100730_01560 [Bacillus velezensis]
MLALYKAGNATVKNYVKLEFSITEVSNAKETANMVFK